MIRMDEWLYRGMQWLRPTQPAVFCCPSGSFERELHLMTEWRRAVELVLVSSISLNQPSLISNPFAVKTFFLTALTDKITNNCKSCRKPSPNHCDVSMDNNSPWTNVNWHFYSFLQHSFVHCFSEHCTRSSWCSVSASSDENCQWNGVSIDRCTSSLSSSTITLQP